MSFVFLRHDRSFLILRDKKKGIEKRGSTRLVDRNPSLRDRNMREKAREERPTRLYRFATVSCPHEHIFVSKARTHADTLRSSLNINGFPCHLPSFHPEKAAGVNATRFAGKLWEAEIEEKIKDRERRRRRTIKS